MEDMHKLFKLSNDMMLTYKLDRPITDKQYSDNDFCSVSDLPIVYCHQSWLE